MGIEEETCWDEHWVLYRSQFDNIFKKTSGEVEIFHNLNEKSKQLQTGTGMLQIYKVSVWEVKNDSNFKAKTVN